jgi:hypothetical protein
MAQRSYTRAEKERALKELRDDLDRLLQVVITSQRDALHDNDFAYNVKLCLVDLIQYYDENQNSILKPIESKQNKTPKVVTNVKPESESYLESDKELNYKFKVSKIETSSSASLNNNVPKVGDVQVDQKTVKREFWEPNPFPSFNWDHVPIVLNNEMDDTRRTLMPVLSMKANYVSKNYIKQSWPECGVLSLNSVMRFIDKPIVDAAFMQTQENIVTRYEDETVHYLNIEDKTIFNFLKARKVQFNIRPRQKIMYDTFRVMGNSVNELTNIDLCNLLNGDGAKTIAAFILCINDPALYIGDTPRVEGIGHYYVILNDENYYVKVDSLHPPMKKLTKKSTWELLSAKSVQYIIIIYK